MIKLLETMPDLSDHILGLAFLLLGILLFVVQLLFFIGFLIFCREVRQITKELKEYVFYILDKEEEDSVKEIEAEREEKALKISSKGQQEALLQEMLGGFLS